MRLQLASLGPGVVLGLGGQVLGGVTGHLYVHSTTTPVNIWSAETGGTESTSGVFVTDPYGHIPGWVDSAVYGEVNIVVPPAATIAVNLTAGFAVGSPVLGNATPGVVLVVDDAGNAANGPATSTVVNAISLGGPYPIDGSYPGIALVPPFIDLQEQLYGTASLLYLHNGVLLANGIIGINHADIASTIGPDPPYNNPAMLTLPDAWGPQDDSTVIFSQILGVIDLNNIAIGTMAIDTPSPGAQASGLWFDRWADPSTRTAVNALGDGTGVGWSLYLLQLPMPGLMQVIAPF